MIQIQKNHERAHELGNFIYILRYIEMNISYLQIETIEALNALRKQKSMAHFLFLQELCKLVFNEYTLTEAWELSIRNSATFLNNEEKNLLIEFSETFGSMDAAEQSKSCLFYIERLEERRKQFENDLKNKDKVNFCLYLFLTFVLCVSLI